LPEELHRQVRDKLEGDLGTLRYSRVQLCLLDIVSGDFFNRYIKQGRFNAMDAKTAARGKLTHPAIGDILLLSEGRPSVDNVFSLKDGTFPPSRSLITIC
jgi:ribonucleases P/MRP protein subunit RPP40